MQSITVLEGWRYALSLLRYLIEAIIPGVVVYVIAGAIVELGGPQWVGSLLGVVAIVLILLGVLATVYKLVVDGTARALEGRAERSNAD